MGRIGTGGAGCPATLLTRAYLIVADVASVSGVSKIVTKVPGGIVEFVAHLRKLAV